MVIDPKPMKLAVVTNKKVICQNAVLNMLAFLGWNPGTEQEIFSKEELIEAFSIEHIHKAGAKFDFEKAKWFNAEYIKKLSDEEISIFSKRNVLASKFGNQDDTYLAKVVGLVKERFVFLNDIELFGYLFQATEKYDATILSKINNIKENFNVDAFDDFLQQQTNTDLIAIETSLKEFATNNELLKLAT
jgi:glutamyl-tRNA synthetase